MNLKAICFLFLFNFLGLFAQEKKIIFFDFDQFTLNQSALQELQSWLSENKSIEVSKIYGYCDWKGTNTYNDSLSIKRVQAVFDFLKQHNITVKPNYEIRGYGEDFEQSKIQSENRKVILVYEIKKEIPIAINFEDESIPLKVKIRSSKVGDIIKLKNLNFYNMTPRVLPKSKPILYELLCALEENPNLKIEIQGHICCQLSGDINGLSVTRARAIYNYLILQKINKKRLSYKGFGVTKPIHPIPEKSDFEQEENRRVEILILEN